MISVKVHDGGSGGSGPIIICGKIRVEIKGGSGGGWERGWDGEACGGLERHGEEGGEGTEEDLLRRS